MYFPLMGKREDNDYEIGQNSGKLGATNNHQTWRPLANPSVVDLEMDLIEDAWCNLLTQRGKLNMLHNDECYAMLEPMVSPSHNWFVSLGFPHELSGSIVSQDLTKLSC